MIARSTQDHLRLNKRSKFILKATHLSGMKLLELTQLKVKDDCLKSVLSPMLMDGQNTISITRISSTQISIISRTSLTIPKSGIKDSKKQAITKM